MGSEKNLSRTIRQDCDQVNLIFIQLSINAQGTREINEHAVSTSRSSDRFEQIQLADARFGKRWRTVHERNGCFRKTRTNGNEDNTGGCTRALVALFYGTRGTRPTWTGFYLQCSQRTVAWQGTAKGQWL